MTPKKLILRNWLAVGDFVMMTATVRDLHKAHPGQYLTDVRTPFPALWRNNPYVTKIADNDPEAELIELHYPAIHQSNQRPRHFVEAMTQYLGDQLGAPIRCTETRGDIRELIREYRPEAILALGVAMGTPRLQLERVALNLNDGGPDNAGEIIRGQLIEPEGPVAYWSTLHLTPMIEALDRLSVPTVISNHTGTFLCNHVFYIARHQIAELWIPSRCGFIHVPGISTGAGDETDCGRPLDLMIAGIERCLEILAKP
jgi:pyroglutamyl-peptidase I